MKQTKPKMMEVFKEDDPVIFFSHISNPFDSFVSKNIVLPNLRNKPARVLDLGCGAGRNVVLAAKMGFDVVGVELYDQPIRVARRYIKQQGLEKKAVIYKKDLFKMKKGELGKFDYCILQEVIEHVNDYQKAIDVAYDALKKHGVLVITTPFNPKLWNIFDEYAGHVRRFTRKEIVEAVKKFPKVKIFVSGFPFYRLSHFIYVSYLRLRKKKHNTAEFIANPVLYNIYTKITPFLLYVDRIFDWTSLGKTIVVIAEK